jgi:hypothetical protein
MWDKLGAIVGLLVGCCLILLRKRYTGLMIRKQLEERTTPKTRKYRQQLKEMKFEGTLHKVLEIAAIAVGVGFVLFSIPEFFPQTERYVRYFIEFFILSFFAAGAAALVEFKFISHFLLRNVHKYTGERYGDSYRSLEISSESDKMDVLRNGGPKDDPVLHALRKKAAIHTVVCFVALFVVFLLAFYTIVRVTS